MKDAASLKLGRLLQLVRSIESELDIQSLSKAEKVLFTSIIDLFPDPHAAVSLTEILTHPDVEPMPQATVYRCLRELQLKKLIRHEGSRGSGIYKLA